MSQANSKKKSKDFGKLNEFANRRESTESMRPLLKGGIDSIEITDEYRKVQSFIEANHPIVFVSGNAGTGKSTMIQYLRSVINKNIVVLAPTGVAALNVEGVTIHSFFRLPPRIHDDEDIKVVYDRKLYQKLELLVIDEVSMVRCDIMDSIDKFLRKNRSNPAPFGGVQLLLIGDLFQLPRVAPKKEWKILQAKGYASRHFFSSFSLKNSSFIHIELTSIYRQSDESFISLLNNIRIGEDIESTISKLNLYCHQDIKHKSDVVLTCTNHSADQINKRELAKLQNKEYTFQGEITGRFNIEEDKWPSPLNLKLKSGAHIMFTKNDALHRWVNGTLGIIREIGEGSISVEIINNSNKPIYYVEQAIWETYKYSYDPSDNRIQVEVIGEYTQYPLMLAWAVTIHKSQGKTLQNVLVDLGNGAFDSGQLYVALSRCQTMDGIQLVRPIMPSDVKCDPIIRHFYSAINELGNFVDL